MNEKETRLLKLCQARGVDGFILRRRANIAWLTDGADTHIDLSTRLGFGMVVWTPQKTTLYADNIEMPRFRAEELAGRDWEFVERHWTDADPHPHGKFLSDWPEDHIAGCRYSLTDAELERVRVLGREATEALTTALKQIKRGATEHMLAGYIAGGLRTRGIFSPVVLVASDERIQKFRHPIPTSKKIESVVMAAICAERHGLVVSATRIVHFGPIPAELRRRHEAVCRVDAAYHAATRPGVRWCDALAAGLKVYKDAGFPDEWRLHHQGGPMGYELREFKATQAETRSVQANQLAGWNPTITGTKSEDTIVSTGEVVTGSPDWPMLKVGEGVERPDILER
jgi:Xaa-Pro aminopeptidase